MIPIRGITVCVSKFYAELLRITLPSNMRHMIECVVVTSPDDDATKTICRDIPNVRVYETDAFTRHGAKFNKGLAMEEGFDALGRDGWILIWDADIVFPDKMTCEDLNNSVLYSAPRLILDDPSQWSPTFDWHLATSHFEGTFIGFYQLFNAEAESIKTRRPWYEVTFAHAGGCDAYFASLFPSHRRRRLPFVVLHLGPCDRNWFGVDDESRTMMNAFLARNGWFGHRKDVKPQDATLVDTIPERVSVPGYAQTGYEMPFIRRRKHHEGNA